MTSAPFRSPATAPFSPNRTASTSGVSGTIRISTSDPAATALGVATTVAAERISSVRLDRSGTISSWPAFFRFIAIGRPMMPSPINPIFTAFAPPDRA